MERLIEIFNMSEKEAEKAIIRSMTQKKYGEMSIYELSLAAKKFNTVVSYETTGTHLCEMTTINFSGDNPELINEFKRRQQTPIRLVDRALLEKELNFPFGKFRPRDYLVVQEVKRLLDEGTVLEDARYMVTLVQMMHQPYWVEIEYLNVAGAIIGLPILKNVEGIPDARSPKYKKGDRMSWIEKYSKILM